MMPKNKFIFNNEYKPKKQNYTINKKNINDEEKEFCDEIEMLLEAEESIYKTTNDNNKKTIENQKSGEIKEMCKDEIVVVQSTETKNNKQISTKNGYNFKRSLTKKDENSEKDNKLYYKTEDLNTACNFFGTQSQETKFNSVNQINKDKQEHIAIKITTDDCKKKKSNELKKTTGSNNAEDIKRDSLICSDIDNLFDRSLFSEHFNKLINTEKEQKCNNNRIKQHKHDTYDVENRKTDEFEKLFTSLPQAYLELRTKIFEKSHQIKLLRLKLEMVKNENERTNKLLNFKIDEIINQTKNIIKYSSEEKINKIYKDIEETNVNMDFKKEISSLQQKIEQLEKSKKQIDEENTELKHKITNHEKEIENNLHINKKLAEIEEQVKENSTNKNKIQKLEEENSKNKIKKNKYKSIFIKICELLQDIILERNNIKNTLQIISKNLISMQNFKKSEINIQLKEKHNEVIKLQTDYKYRIRCMQEEVEKLRKTKRKKKIAPSNSDIWNVFEN